MFWFVSALLIKFTLIGLWLGGFVSSAYFLFLWNPLTAYVLFKAHQRVQENKLYPYTILFLDVFLPTVGLLSLSLFYLAGFVFRNINYHEESEDLLYPYESSSFHDFEINKKVELESFTNDQGDLLESFDVEPLQQVLIGEYDKELKISAIEKLSRIADREAIKILKKGLKEKEYEVRYFSNGALEEIEKARLERINSYTEAILENPDNTDHYNERATAYLEVYRLGLLDKSVEKAFLEKALFDFMTSLSLGPTQSYLYTRIIEINLLLGNYKELISLSEYAIASPITDEDKAKIHFYQAEAHYFLGNFDKSKEFCIKAASYPVHYDLIDSCLKWWTHVA
jgi:tetratricopeptide (TPR) repeat protein